MVVARQSPSGEENPLKILCSLDGYYECFCVSSPPPRTAADGETGSKEEEEFASEVKKKYRRLCLSHHPDKGGDAETFQALNRAYKVLTTVKLKKQYDLLGLDLEDDEEHHDSSTENDIKGEENDESSSNSAMAQIAAVVIATIVQILIRTATIAVTTVFIPNYIITTIICLMLIWTMWFLNRKELSSHLPVIFTTLGIICMYYGGKGSWFFWIGETFMITFSAVTSLPPDFMSKPFIAIAAVVSSIFSLILKGRFWRYLLLLTFEGVILLVAIILMPVLEMVVDELVNAKLMRYGEKLRSHVKRLEREMERK